MSGNSCEAETKPKFCDKLLSLLYWKWSYHAASMRISFQQHIQTTLLLTKDAINNKQLIIIPPNSPKNSSKYKIKNNALKIKVGYDLQFKLLCNSFHSNSN